MRISEFEFRPDNNFVAIEYYWLILNRTFLILISDKELIGITVSNESAFATCLRF
jgi:hypothetical protein